MDVREKLVELVKNALRAYGKDLEKIVEPYEFIADFLIHSGVTVQEWISVKDKLPPYNRDVLVYRPNMAMKILVDNYALHYRDDDDEWYEDWALYGKDADGNPIITHWSYLPQPPEMGKMEE